MRSHPSSLLRIPLAAGILLGIALARGAPPRARAALPVTPVLSCVTVDTGSGLAIAYFGYNNTGTTAYSISVGQNNQLSPVSPFQGQPDFFNIGSYPSVFPVQFNLSIFPTVAYILNGAEADASVSSPRCGAHFASASFSPWPPLWEGRRAIRSPCATLVRVIWRSGYPARSWHR